MKKTIIAAVTAALLSSVSAPAFAGDGARLGIGIGMAILGEVIKGAGKGGSRQSRREPGKGDTLLGRVGDDNTPSRNNSARKRNSVAPAAGAGAAVAAAVTLPEAGPQIEFRPSDAEVAALLARPPSNSDDDGQTVTMLDEGGVTWGNVSPEVADKVEKAVGLGMLRSQAIAALTDLKEPQPTKEQADAMTTAAVADADNTPPAGQQTPAVEVAQGAFAPVPTATFEDGSDGSELLNEAPAEPVKKASADDRNGDYGTIWSRDRSKGTVLDEAGNVWGDMDAATIAKIDGATASGMKRSEAIAANSDWAAPGRTKAAVAAEAAQKAESERKWAEAQRQAEVAADAEQERLAAAQAAREKARAEEIAAAERKRKDDAERAAAEAALPDILRGSSQESAAVSPSTTPNTLPVEKLPAVDAQATTASTKSDTPPKAVIDVAPAQPEKVAPAKKSGMKIDL